jgi:hypothetical protein
LAELHPMTRPQKITPGEMRTPGLPGSSSFAATTSARTRWWSLPIAGPITSGYRILSLCSLARLADIVVPMPGRISARLRSGPARGELWTSRVGPDHPLGPRGMAKIERKDDSWRKTVCAHSARRRESFRCRSGAGRGWSHSPSRGRRGGRIIKPV